MQRRGDAGAEQTMSNGEGHVYRRPPLDKNSFTTNDHEDAERPACGGRGHGAETAKSGDDRLPDSGRVHAVVGWRRLPFNNPQERPPVTPRPERMEWLLAVVAMPHDIARRLLRHRRAGREHLIGLLQTECQSPPA